MAKTASSSEMNAPPMAAATRPTQTLPEMLPNRAPLNAPISS